MSALLLTRAAGGGVASLPTRCQPRQMPFISLADKAHQRLYRRFRRLVEHKPSPVVAVAVDRELVGVLWAALQPKSA